ncbi:hypothetical protein MIR68_006039 [Amoeboaphelidium protococcarum]|nr:hypothetical protein MIR68_006039 [Amoeboaphelidium protococcarum]KAI3654283.1 hypothetical protein MP228_001002 [Amoeboaphelidium protococcarum]
MILRQFIRRRVHTNSNGIEQELSWGKYMRKNRFTIQLILAAVATHTACLFTMMNLLIAPLKDEIKNGNLRQSQQISDFKESQSQQISDFKENQNQQMSELKSEIKNLSDKFDNLSGSFSHLEDKVDAVLDLAMKSSGK